MAKKQFKAQSKRLLEMMIHSIYSQKEIFLRELISNASDAIDKSYYLALENENIEFDKEDFYIRLSVDADKRTLTIEDTGIVLGNAIKKAVGDKKGIKRYGSCILPMDETLVLCAVDLSGRPYLVFDAEFTTDRVGYMDTEMVKEFFYAISYTAGMNLHIKVLSGGNNHHMIEAMFKAFAKALDEATIIDPRITDILSTKGSL